MNKTAELVVHFNKEGYWKVLVIAPVMIVAMVALLLFYSQIHIAFPGWPLLTSFISYIISVVKTFFYIGIAFFLFILLIGLLYAPFFLGCKGPAAILNQDGIWVRYHNFISWKDVEEFSLYTIARTPLESIKIQVKDVTRLSKQSNWDGKLRIFWAKLFGTPHITLSNLDTANEDIIIFAQRYLKGSK